MSRVAELKRRNLIRNIAIAFGLILTAFLAKMEAINFMIALYVGILVMIRIFKPLFASFDRFGEIVDNKLHPFPLALIFRFLWEILSHRPLYSLWFFAGILSGYLTYFLLNMLFISP